MNQPVLAKVRVLLYTSVHGKGQRQHEDQLLALGFTEVEQRDYPTTAPNLSKFGCVVAVIDQVKRDAWVIPQTAARLAGVSFFAVMRRSSDPSWIPLREWAASMFGTAQTSVFEDAAFADASREAVAELDKLHKEIAGWQKLATEYGEEKDAAEKERDRAIAQLKDNNSELARVKELAEATRRNAITVKRELEEAQKFTKEHKAQVDELATRLVKSDARVRELEVTARDLRQQLTDVKVAPPETDEVVEELKKKLNSSDTMLRKARGERDDARAQLKTSVDGKGVSDVAKQLWALVESDVLDAEEAFDKLVKYVGGEP